MEFVPAWVLCLRVAIMGLMGIIVALIARAMLPTHALT